MTIYVVKVSISVVKSYQLYVKWHFVDVLCFSWRKHSITKPLKLKKALLFTTRPFYENTI